MVPTLGVRSTELCMGLLNPLHRTPDTNVNIASQLYLNSNNKKKSYNLLYKFNMHAFVSTLLLINYSSDLFIPLFNCVRVLRVNYVTSYYGNMNCTGQRCSRGSVSPLSSHRATGEGEGKRKGGERELCSYASLLGARPRAAGAPLQGLSRLTQVSIFLRIIANLSPWQQISLLVGHAPQTRTVPRPLQTSPAASPGTPCAPGSQPQLWDAPSTFLAPCSSAVPLAAEVVAASGTSYWCIPASPVLPLHNILVLINDFFVLNFPVLVEGKTSIP